MYSPNYIAEHKKTPADAMREGLSAGAAGMMIRINNGAIEVTNSNGTVLLQTKNVKDGTWGELWNILETCGDIDFRAKG